MKKLFLLILLLVSISNSVFAEDFSKKSFLSYFKDDTREIKALLNSQVRYANKTNFKKFISTYDENYLNADGLDLEKYSALVKDVWNCYDNIVYDIEVKNIQIDGDKATVDVIETSKAEIPSEASMDGTLSSVSNSVYYLKKVDGKWKVYSDKVRTENTSMLYGDARLLDISLTAPNEIEANTEYTASLEFVPPEGVIAIASIANDKVEYPQKQAKEVFRKLPEDNILERLFVSNSDNMNEYVIASIGLTKADVTDLSIKLSLTGFGYQITRVNVIPVKKENNVEENIK